MRVFLKVLLAMELADSVPNLFYLWVVGLNGTHEQESIFIFSIVEAEGCAINRYVIRDAIKRQMAVLPANSCKLTG